MKKYIISVLVVILFSTQNLFAQPGYIAVPFLGIHPGPNLNAMAGAFTALLKYLAAGAASSVLKYTAAHFKLNYVFTHYSSSGPRNGTEFQGLSVSVLGF